MSNAGLELVDLVRWAVAGAGASVALIRIGHTHEALRASALIINRRRQRGAGSTKIVLGTNRRAHFSRILSSLYKKLLRFMWMLKLLKNFLLTAFNKSAGSGCRKSTKQFSARATVSAEEIQDLNTGNDSIAL